MCSLDVGVHEARGTPRRQQPVTEARLEHRLRRRCTRMLQRGTHHVLVDPALSHCGAASTIHRVRETSRDRQWTRDRKLPRLSDPVVLVGHPTIRHPIRCCGRTAHALPLQTDRGERKTFL